MDYTKHVTNRRKTPQTEKVPGVKNQAKNNAGGVSFKLSAWDYLMRFLILGTEGGTYYVNERKLTRDAAKKVQRCIDADGILAVDTIVKISTSGRSSNNDAAIFALAMAASASEDSTRRYALENVHKVCRIGTHLFHFVQFVKTMRGFGRGLRQALAEWYTHKPIGKLAYQMLKYQGRDGWTHGDIIRLAHPVPENDDMSELFAYATGNRNTIPRVSDYAIGMRQIFRAMSPREAANLISKHELTREAVPTEFLNDRIVWDSLFERMPMMALVRNLGKMASLGMHKPMSDSLRETCEKLTDEGMVRRSKIHPIQVMNALLIYRNGCGFKGSLNWEVSGKVVDALEHCFYTSFDNVTPTGKNIMLALDVSGSMTDRLNNSFMSCRVASAVLAMVTMKSEENTDIVGFTSQGKKTVQFSGNSYWGGSNGISQLSISPRQRLDDVVANVSNLPFGMTDCALPMQYCEKLDIDVDAIVIYTDNETYAGNMHPWQALDRLEQKLGHQVKCVVVGMTSTGFSIARPEYSNMLDVVGFDTNTPAAISEFIRD
jgi:60 kDa SS-A/Ro ribonucleoprotein